MKSCSLQKVRASAMPSFEVVAAAAFADVVEQRSRIQHPWPLEVGNQLAAKRVFVRVLGDGKTPDVAQHHQDVLIDRIDMVKIMLHLADDAPEVEQVASQHTGLVQQPHHMRDALRPV